MRLTKWFRSLVHRSKVEQELDEELRYHIERQIDVNVKAGMSAKEARYAALREFGGVAQLQEECREARNTEWLTGLGKDLRFGVRMLRKNPGFTTAAVATLALGIGANAAIFSLLYSAVLKPLPYPNADRLMSLQAKLDLPGRGQITINWSYPKFEDLRRLSTAFESLAGFWPWSFNITGAGDPERIDGEIVTGNYFDTLGVKPLLGRAFLSEEDRTPGTHPVLIISEGMWKRKLGGRTEALGSTISVNELPYTIVGVMPASFAGESGKAELWTPVMMAPVIMNNPKRLQARMAHWFSAFGRLKGDVTPVQAAADLENAVRRMEEAIPSSKDPNEKWGGAAIPMATAKSDPVLKRALLVLFGAVMFVLLIACINVATLLLSRAVVRRREMAIRQAMGASRGSIIRQLLAESLTLSVFGGAAGLAFAALSLDLLRLVQGQVGGSLDSAIVSRLNLAAVTLDWNIMAFTAAITLLTGVLFGLAPAIQASRPDPSTALKSADSLWVERFRATRLLGFRGALVTAQVALAVVLLAGAGLMLQSLAKLMQTRMGFESEGVLTFRISLPGAKYGNVAVRQFHTQLVTALRSLPGVESASVASTLPLSGQNETTVGKIDNIVEIGEARVHMISPEYFKTLSIPLIKGRLLTDRDGEGAPHVALIGETAAQRYWPGQNPIGHRIALGLEGWSKPEEQAEIVGVVGDVKYRRIESPADFDVYLSSGQRMPGTASVALRTKAHPTKLGPAIRAELKKLDATLPIYRLMPMDQIVAEATSMTRFNGTLLSLFAALALALAMIGIFGMVSYSVSARTRELGIRSALGARRSQLLGMALSDGLKVGVTGVLLGVPLAIAATRVLRGMLHEVKAGDPTIMLAASLLILLVALLACYIPARRAASVDPATTLRAQ